MPVLSFDPPTFCWSRPGGGGGVFRPDGFPKTVGDFAPSLHDRFERQQERHAARQVVPLRARQRRRSTADVATVVARVRSRPRPTATWFWIGPGRPHYAGERRAGKCVQVVLRNLPRVSAERFRDEAVEGAEALARELRLTEIAVQLQRNGVEEGVLGVTPPGAS